MLTLKDYDRFCLADPDFYDVPERYPDDHDRLAAARRPAPEGWERSEWGWWVTLRPQGAAPPRQGWRIHVSVALPELARAVEIVWGHCVAAGLPFDFVRSRATARELGDDRADRLAGGRLITVYPADDSALEKALGDLGVLLDGLAGAYVLGALRHRSGPLYVRYGTHGTDTLERPDGTREPASRRAVFTPPDWLPLPEVLRPDLAALHAPAAGDFPYRVEHALSLRAGGGTYLATDRRTGERLVLREARPHAGLDRRGEDAVTRLGRLWALRGRLAGLECVPRPVEHRTWGEHHFLAEEFLEGTCLEEAASAAFPLTSGRRAAAEAGPYTAWALGVVERVAAALEALADRGLRPAELRPRDVLLRPGGGVALACPASLTGLDDEPPPAAGPHDFRVPDGRTGTAAARYLLDRLRLWLFLPLPYRGPEKLHTLTAAVERHYPVPPGFGARLLAGLWPAGHPAGEDRAAAPFAARRPDWPTIRDSLVRGIHAAATPDRPDRLFPATPTGPSSLGGHSFGYGAAGVLYALHQVGAGVPDAYTDWLIRAAERDPRPRPGLYDGLHGVALTLELLGRREAALAAIDRCRPLEERVTDAGLAGGSAGIALNLLRFAGLTGDGALYDRALRAAGRAARAVEDGPPPAAADAPAPYGLLHGATGVAVLHLRLYEETGDLTCLDVADRALRHDTARLTTLPDGTVTLFDGTVGLPYLHGGSTGLAFAVRDLLAHRPDADLAALLEALRRTCDPVHVHNCGLLRGRAGAVATLAALGEGPDSPAVLRQVRRLAWHARTHRGHLAFPGFRLLRLSSDLATGAAGVLLALGRAFDGTGPVLPFLDPRPSPRPHREGGEGRVGDPGAAGAGRGGDPGSVAV
ncbi:class III lanthionine synthetase LanKC [Streptomyces griseocarneus]|uniref:class III lanthionine synthetase LanKC n=1 Tax=Streptomyces griseocarneus TaxID=51201 RepID=UPI00167E00F6|nr:class III lanthionine synthetase LanKC [Streptomyces griseocarneus]MBZ6474216.1 class III lanthionine synthetase LanKC [Streptomyces griseocarneus]GHG52657.1 serine/threonine protein kinase [Streptomyces griseocarneus]